MNPIDDRNMYRVVDLKTGTVVAYTFPTVSAWPLGDAGFTSIVYIDGAEHTRFQLFQPGGLGHDLVWVDEQGKTFTTKDHKKFIVNLNVEASKKKLEIQR